MTGRWFGFAREAAVGGGLSHPHIVTVHDAASPLVELVVLDEAEEPALLAALLVGRVLRDKLLHDEGRLLSAGRRWGVIMLGSAADDAPAGATLLLYTDGLVESRIRDVWTGIEQLRERLTQVGRLTGPSAPSLEALFDEVLDMLDPGDRDDDIALLAARFDGVPDRKP